MTRVLVFNRGEIAFRACQAARKLGIESVLFATEEDLGGPALGFADDVVLHAGPAATAFRDLDVLTSAIAQSAATHVYPGYGFLAESPELAQAVEASGARFVGPPVPALRMMAHKERAQEFARLSGLPHLGVALTVRDGQLATEPGVRFPLLLKAAAGGGGRGNSVVASVDQLASTHAALQVKAEKLFGDGDVLAERFLSRARHVELQIFAHEGHVWCLGTRDCSLQRNHQKVIEEGPASQSAVAAVAAHQPGICDALQRLGYRGAGTIEMLLDLDTRELFFLEMNTRIQVEHSVTEMLCGVDLVEWQLREATGRSAPFDNHTPVGLHGHAVEARIYAEDPEAGFRPDPGPVNVLDLPRLPFVRCDVGLVEGAQVSPHFDPMIAKLLAWGRTREEAFGRLVHALDSTTIHGVRTNLRLLRALASDPRVIADEHHTRWLEQTFLPLPPSTPAPDIAIAGVVANAAFRTESIATERKDHELTWKTRHRF